MMKFYNLGGGLISPLKLDKIATEAEAYAIGGKGTPNGNKACTNARALELGCKAVSSHSSNLLVPKSSLAIKSIFITVKGRCYLSWTGSVSRSSKLIDSKPIDKMGNTSISARLVFSEAIPPDVMPIAYFIATDSTGKYIGDWTVSNWDTNDNKTFTSSKTGDFFSKDPGWSIADLDSIQNDIPGYTLFYTPYYD